jgi:UDP-N-acetylglucosamine 2-epimerase (non-hydrolysing)
MIQVLSVFGTRPEAVKMAPIIKEMRNYSGRIVSHVCVTAQHRELLDQVLTLFDIKPDYDLDLMRPKQSLEQLTANILLELTSVIKEVKPDWVLVQGDTTTVMAAAIAAFYAGVKVGHVEAGLRTYNKAHPFPEEINRRIASVIADLHFAPTASARENLLRENVAEDRIVVTGNPVIDALWQVATIPYDPAFGPLSTIPWDKKIILVTAHRRENFGESIENICKALQILSIDYCNDIHIVYPVHPNPNVQDPVHKFLSNIPNITLLPPLSYQPLVYLMKRSYLILTDSGGLQEEAPGLGKPVLVLRETTERPEAVAAGVVKLVGTNKDNIVENSKLLLDNSLIYSRMAQATNPYGDGKAATRIVEALLK